VNVASEHDHVSVRLVRLEGRELQVEIAQDVDTHDRVNLDLISVSRLKPLGTPSFSVLPRVLRSRKRLHEAQINMAGLPSSTRAAFARLRRTASFVFLHVLVAFNHVESDESDDFHEREDVSALEVVDCPRAIVIGQLLRVQHGLFEPGVAVCCSRSSIFFKFGDVQADPPWTGAANSALIRQPLPATCETGWVPTDIGDM
jgi:hypothetical protein